MFYNNNAMLMTFHNQKLMYKKSLNFTLGGDFLSGRQLEETECEWSEKFWLVISGAKDHVSIVGQFVQHFENDDLSR